MNLERKKQIKEKGEKSAHKGIAVKLALSCESAIYHVRNLSLSALCISISILESKSDRSDLLWMPECDECKRALSPLVHSKFTV